MNINELIYILLKFSHADATREKTLHEIEKYLSFYRLPRKGKKTDTDINILIWEIKSHGVASILPKIYYLVKNNI
jgi:hypothetical protein